MRNVLVILFLAINSVLSATNYYVKNGGSDAASGTSDVTAWEHHPWMSTWTGHITLVAGDNVFMKRANIWSISSPSAPFMTVSQSGSTGRPITTTAYGTGAKPILKIATDANYPVIEGFGKSYITFDNLDIQNSSSARSIVYEKDGICLGKDINNNVPHDWIITNCDIHNIPKTGIMGYDDSYNIIIGNINAASCATDITYSNQIYDCGYAGVILCGRNSVTNRSDLSVFGNYIHNIDYTTSAEEDGVAVSFTSETVGSSKGYSTGWPNYCRAKYNFIANVPGGGGIDCHGGSYIYFQDNYVKDCRIGIITQATDRKYAETAILDNGYIEGNVIENSGNAITGSNHAFIYVVAENVLFRATNCYVRNNTLLYTSRPSAETGAMGIVLYNVDNVTVDGNKVYNGPVGSSGGGILLNSSGSNKVKNVIISDNWIYNWDKGIDVLISGIDGDISVFNNIVYSHRRSFVGEGGTLLNNLMVYNNTFLHGANAVQPYVIDFVLADPVTIAVGASLTIKNNILGFTSPISSGIYIYPPVTINGTFTCDYNLYWNSTYATPFNDKYNLTIWKTFGYENHSPNATSSLDPLFINTSGTYSNARDFFLQSPSPAINKGTVVDDVSDDFFGNPRDATPDIGAYEYIIRVTSITVTGADGSNTITTNKGTLQLISSVLPADIANKKVTWSIPNGTGQASISSSGLVTAITDGTVAAMATATDGSGVYGTLFITISNQDIPDSTNYREQPVKIFPNPAHEFVNIRIFDPTLIPDFIRIITLSGKVIFQEKVNPDITELQIPLNLIEGIYILQMGSGNMTLFTQKLIVRK
jgi:hypothetical protein